MALNWNLSKVTDYKKVCYIPKPENNEFRLHPITDALLWLSLRVDLGNISTEKSIEEWMWRISFLRRWDGYKTFHWNTESKQVYPEWEEDFSPLEITKNDLIRHIGLITNVINIPRKSWLKKTLNYFCNNINPAMDEVFTDSIVRIEVRNKILSLQTVKLMLP